MDLGTAYLESAIKRFREYKTLGDKTFAQLSTKDFLFQPNEASNSIAIIIQHLHGNMLSRWTNFLNEDGKKIGDKEMKNLKNRIFPGSS
jgi:hypothetical protein